VPLKVQNAMMTEEYRSQFATMAAQSSSQSQSRSRRNSHANDYRPSQREQSPVVVTFERPPSLEESGHRNAPVLQQEADVG